MNELTKWITVLFTVTIVLGSGVVLYLDPLSFKIDINNITTASYKSGSLKIYDSGSVLFYDGISVYHKNSTATSYSTAAKMSSPYTKLEYYNDSGVYHIKQNIRYKAGNLTRFFWITEAGIVKQEFEWSPIDKNTSAYFVWNYKGLPSKSAVYVDSKLKNTSAPLVKNARLEWKKELGNIISVKQSSSTLAMRTKVYKGDAKFDPYIFIDPYVVEAQIYSDGVTFNLVDDNNATWLFADVRVEKANSTEYDLSKVSFTSPTVGMQISYDNEKYKISATDLLATEPWQYGWRFNLTYYGSPAQYTIDGFNLDYKFRVSGIYIDNDVLCDEEAQCRWDLTTPEAPLLVFYKNKTFDPEFSVYNLTVVDGNVAGVNVSGRLNNYTYLTVDGGIYSNVVAYFPFDKDSSTTAYDLSNNNLTGTYTNGAYSSSICGKYDDGACFDGSNDYIVTGTINMNTTSITYMGWIKPYPTASNDFIMRSGTSNPQYDMVYTSGAFYCSGNGSVTSSIALTQGQWQHVACVHNGTDLLFYHNGIFNNSASAPYPANTNRITLGSYTGGSSYSYKGSIDEFMAFNSALNSSQISDIYNNQSQRHFQQGIEYTPQITLSSPSNNSVNFSITDYETNYNTSINVSMGYWKPEYGYNDTTTETGLNAGLVAYYHADNVTGNGNVVAGQVGNALLFDGANDYVQFNTLTLSNITTVSVWAKSDSASNFKPVLSQLSAIPGVWIRYSGAQIAPLVVLANSGVYKYFTDPSGYHNDSNWHHWLFIVNKDNVSLSTLYIDGVIAGNSTVSGTNASSASPVYLGRGGATYYYPGILDEVKVWNRSLSIIEIANLYGNESSGQTDPNLNITGLILQYTLNESNTSSWASTTPDTSGNNNHGAEIGMIGANITDSSGNSYNGITTAGAKLVNEGKYNQTFTFDGTAGYAFINTTGKSELNVGTGDISASLWFITPSVVSTPVLLCVKWAEDSLCGIRIYASSTSLYVDSRNDAGTQKYQSTPFTDRTSWHHVVLRRTSGTVTGYLDGVAFTGTAPGTLANKSFTTPQYIQIAKDTSTATWNGSIDEVMIFNRSLSATEIKELYSRGRANWQYTDEQVLQEQTHIPNYTAYFNDSSVVAEYRADEVTGNGNVITGKISNALTFDGTNDYVSAYSYGNINNSNSFMGWIKVNNDTGSFFGNFNTIGGGNYWWESKVNINSSHVFRIRRVYGGTTVYSFDYYNQTAHDILNDGNWHHLAAVSNGTYWFMYFDGVNVPTTDAGTLWGDFTCTGCGGSRWGIAGDEGKGGDYLNASIDEFRYFNRSLTASEIANIYSNESVGQHDPNMNRTGLLLEYTMNESADSLWATTTPDSSGNNKHGVETGWRANITDSSGNGNNGETVRGVTLVNDGLGNTSFTFDGIGGYVTIPNSPSLNQTNLTNQITVGGWVKKLSSLNNKGVISKWGGSSELFQYLIYISPADRYNWQIRLANGSSVSAVAPSTIIDTNWHHILGTYNGAVVALYIDGNLVASTVTSGNINGGLTTQANTLGDYQGSNYFNGSIDEVIIMNRSLSATEVQNLYLNSKRYRSMNTFVIPSGSTNIAPTKKLISTGWYTPYVGQEGTLTFFESIVNSLIELGEGISKLQWIVQFLAGDTAYNVEPTNQTASIGIFKITNAEGSANLTMKINSTNSNITTWCSLSNSYSSPLILSTSWQTLAITSNTNERVWCRRNYSGIPYPRTTAGIQVNLTQA
jgi:hypothetical protein